VFTEAEIARFKRLIALRGLDEDRKSESRDKLAGRIRLLHEVIDAGLCALLNKADPRKSAESADSAPSLMGKMAWGQTPAVQGLHFHGLRVPPAGMWNCKAMTHRPRFQLRLRHTTLPLGERTLIMGILNVTPDSFSDGGRFLEPASAVARAVEIERQGASILDIGAESTRPGSTPVSEEEETARLLPVLHALEGRISIPVSVDTYKPGVAERALAAGAQLVNFPALSPVADMAAVAHRAAAPLVLMHVRGRPADMHRLPPLDDVAGHVHHGLEELRDQALAAGLPRDALILDPGFGFGKNGDENYRLLARLSEFHSLGCPLLAGTSRKAFIGLALGTRPAERAWGTAATVAAAVLAGAHIVRVHDVAEMAQVAGVADRLLS
jgi:dihydropteroate synthase